MLIFNSEHLYTQFTYIRFTERCYLTTAIKTRHGEKKHLFIWEQLINPSTDLGGFQKAAATTREQKTIHRLTQKPFRAESTLKARTYTVNQQEVGLKEHGSCNDQHCLPWFRHSTECAALSKPGWATVSCGREEVKQAPVLTGWSGPLRSPSRTQFSYL